MSLATSPVTGTIRIEPRPWTDGRQAARRDATLDLLLEAFAHNESLAHSEADDDETPVRLVSARFRTRPADAGIHVCIRANLGQLMADLQAEYDQLAG